MENINTVAIAKIAFTHWKKLSIVAVVAIIASSFFSSPIFIAPKYKSSTVIFPSNLVSFSDESNTEQLLQFINSEELKNAMAKRFDLYNHYGIDSTEEKAVSKFNEFYNSNFSASSTLYESVDIEVIDVSKELAQKMANAIVEEVNKLILQTKKNIVSEYVKSYSNQLKIKETEIDSIESKLKYMRVTYGLIDVKAQSKVISKRLGKSMSETDTKILKGLQEYGGEYTLLQSQLNVEINSYKDLKANYDKNLLDYNGKLSYTTVISKANLPDKKCAPLRMVIVVLFTLSSLLLALTILLFNTKKQN
jgi:capsule polysaccharide export protein KpsE/RkpR